MIADLKPYPAMKDSGVEWLGDVPEHWDVRKLRSIMTRNTQRNRPDLPLLSVVREKGVILRDVTSKDKNHNFIPDDLTNYKVVREGQLAMNKMKAWQGSYGISPYDGIVSPAYFIFDVNGVEGKFFHTAIRSKAYVPQFTQASDGVRIGQWDLSEDRMREIPFVVPPLAEQAVIVRFLDYVDRRVRRYVRAKQKLIGLLEEQKQAIIHRAVTRGLDPNVPLKPSGVEWLGDVPEGWSVTRLGFVARVSRGTGYQNVADANEDDKSIRMIRISDFADFQPIRVRYSSELEVFKVCVGDILIAGTGATAGITMLVSSDMEGQIHSYNAPRIHCFDVEPRFLYFVLNSHVVKLQEELLFTGSAQHFLDLSSISHLQIPWCSRSEQQAIAMFLEESESRLNILVSEARSSMEKIGEYRTRLIADVVTGKLDVREAAANLPDETGEPEAPDEFDDLIDRDEAMADDLDSIPEEAEA